MSNPFTSLFKGAQAITFYHANAVLVVMALVIALLGFLSPDKIDAGNGLGFDGRTYGKIAQNPQTVFELNSYRIQRILPSLLVHAGLRLASAEFTPKNVVFAFGVLNVFLIVLMAYLWGLISDELRLTIHSKYLGFVLLFVNFAVMKFPSYYPVLTDMASYAMGMAMLYFYLTSRTISLYVVTILGAWIWPLIVYQGIFLLFFPRDRTHQDQDTSGHVRYRLHLLAGFVAALGILAITGIKSIKNHPPLNSVVPLSIAIAVIYTFFSVSNLLKAQKFFAISTYLGYLRRGIMMKVALIATLVVLRIFQDTLSAGPGTVGISDIAGKIVVYGSTALPGKFYVGNVSFFGPILIIATFLWARTCRIIHTYGIALSFCCLLLLIPFSFIGEGRLLFSLYPFLVPFVVRATEALSWKPAYYWFLFVLAILMSKVWLIIGSVFSSGGAYSQLYMMHFGPWMSPKWYIIQGSITLFIAYMIYTLLFMHQNAKEKGESLYYG